MTSAESILHQAAADGSLDPAEWPKTLQYILDRLDEVCLPRSQARSGHDALTREQILNEFPKPTAVASAPSAATTPARPQNALSSQESQATDKENAPPLTPTRPPVPAFAAPADTQALPQETTNFYASIRSALSTNFPKNPPHTIQRLAELILEPKRRYKYLPPYLRALDRVVNVSSPTTIFPLPQAILPTAGGLLNGTTSTPTSQSAPLGSDEALGGALLTPIPWLQNRGTQNELISESTEIVEGPHGAGRIETVTVGMMNNALNASAPPVQTPPPNNSQIASSHPEGETLPATGPVTQGEILRQEQEAGIVLNNPHTLTSHPARTKIAEAEGGAPVVETVEGEEEAPHARGPEIIGMEDTGPQKPSGGLDIEGAVGRPSIERSSKSPQPPSATTAAAAEEESKDEEMKDGSEAADEPKEKPDEEMKTDG
ncbi:hypothetical protein BS50DRAFT_610357 [Corynespora cassiicola Philippines]|uniref:PPP4R2-domain-containing protein n=1 Tax=Corynespora cassiicola Philippines TaxID=1448308 RepID=A0A2T2NNY2_CORCC|nr:hypothetical protein BS50DRAFT_610357 [Corynespora cassiicola Philippines]